jgi:asparagine synthase (glutamine-hydrolysing)
MCGIAGFLSLDEKAHHVGLASLKAMVQSVRNRGPDESGVYIDDYAGLGHCRLSIVGLAGGGQPIHDEDKTLWIVFNGEIYNYIELREGLLRRGHRFYTSTDTEVIVHLFQERGRRCVEDFNGQFAFAIWDPKKKELFLARDRLGVRPLHFAVYDGVFLFASEIKSILALPGMPHELDILALDQVFTFWTTLPGKTLFKNILELMPGHTLSVAGGSLKAHKYWDIPLYPRDAQSKLPLARMAADVQDLLIDSIRIRLRADVTVGTYLSGGLDSSGITSLVVRNFNSNVRTFGITFEDDRFDESRYQRLMVEYLSVNHSEVAATNNKIRENFGQVIWHAEKPLLRTAPVPLFLLSRLVHESNVKVVLTGEGADEFFGGYDIFREALARRFWARNTDSRFRYLLVEGLYPDIFETARARMSMRNFFKQGLADVNHPFFSHLPRWTTTSRTKSFFSNDLRDALKGYNALDDCATHLPEDFGRLDVLAKAQYLEATIFLSNYLLSSQGDRVAMGNSVEIRFPYLDHRLLEYLGHVPTQWKILGLNEKHILKRVFSEALPKEISRRPKQAYRAPVQTSLIDGSNNGFVESHLSEQRLKATGLFDPAKVQMLIARIRAGSTRSETEGMALSGIVSSQMFHQLFIEDFAPKLSDCTFTVTEDHRSAT